MPHGAVPFVMNIKDKETYFEEGLMARFRIYNRFLSVGSKMSEVAVTEVDAVFKRTLPKNELELSQVINNLLGLVDRETLAGQLPFVTNAKETVELARQEVGETTNSNDIPDANATEG